MKLNCKKCDKAIIVGAFNRPDFIGRIVSVVDGPRLNRRRNVYYWKVDIDLDGHSGVADKHLRPLRDSDGEDETLTWAGKPEKKEKETT